LLKRSKTVSRSSGGMRFDASDLLATGRGLGPAEIVELPVDTAEHALPA
jgi:hypothetical protein